MDFMSSGSPVTGLEVQSFLVHYPCWVREVHEHTFSFRVPPFV